MAKNNVSLKKPGSGRLFHGAAYYPEAWDWENIERDIELMQKAGLNVVRMFEFAWSEMEPREGEFRFERFHAVLNALHAAGISSVLGTPVSAPPAWLTLNYPQTMLVTPEGWPHGHGARRHYCPNSPLYHEKTRIICEAMAKALGGHPGAIAWQTDNEINPSECATRRRMPWQVGCFCSECRRLFKESLKAQFHGSIEDLNRYWGMNIWSERYDSFEQIEPPAMSCICAPHPSLAYAWIKFVAQSYVEFHKIQIDAIRKYSRLPITHNAMPLFHLMDYDALFGDLDFVSNDFYGPPSEMPVLLKELDWMRPISKRRFWVMETSANWSGGTAAAHPAHPPGFVRAKAWTHIAAGGEATLYWLFRGHWSGQELLHGSVYHHFGAPAPCFEDIRQHSQEIRKPEVFDFVLGTEPVQAQVALHYAARSQWAMRLQHFTRDFDNYAWEYTRFHAALVSAGLLRDVIFESTDPNSYKIVFTPLMPIVTPELFDKMRAFTEGGGVWVAGPMTDLRTVHNTWPRQSATAHLEAWSGARVELMFPARGANIKVRVRGIGLCEADGWALAFGEDNRHEVIARYTSDPAKGMPAIVLIHIGKGCLVFVGAALRGKDRYETGCWARLCSKLAKKAGVTDRTNCSWGTVMYSRRGPAGSGVIAANWSGRGTVLRLEAPGRELLSGKKTGKELRLPPFEVAVIRYDL